MRRSDKWRFGHRGNALESEFIGSLELLFAHFIRLAAAAAAARSGRPFVFTVTRVTLGPPVVSFETRLVVYTGPPLVVVDCRLVEALIGDDAETLSVSGRSPPEETGG